MPPRPSPVPLPLLLTARVSRDWVDGAGVGIGLRCVVQDADRACAAVRIFDDRRGKNVGNEDVAARVAAETARSGETRQRPDELPLRVGEHVDVVGRVVRDVEQVALLGLGRHPGVPRVGRTEPRRPPGEARGSLLRYGTRRRRRARRRHRGLSRAAHEQSNAKAKTDAEDPSHRTNDSVPRQGCQRAGFTQLLGPLDRRGARQP